MSLADRCDQIVRLIDDALRDDLPPADDTRSPSFDPGALCAVPYDAPDADPDGPAVRHVAA